MENKTISKCWNYELVYYVPTTPEGGGDIVWNEVSEFHEIFLPADVTDPERYLQESRSDNCVGLEFSRFSELRVK